MCSIACKQKSSQRTQEAKMTSSLRHNEVVTSFWRNNDVIITPCVHRNTVCSDSAGYLILITRFV